jgi:septal ring factor EnvC (AmiA/AmiB activator)|tara:strand:- start:422 stop:1006 length:585 start_codon:yes stop_codon:yes gene_type:complete
MRIGNSALLLLGLLASTAAQAELYRYVDDKGVVVLDRHGVPPQFIGRGYEVLNDQGRVTQVVPPAPTAQERKLLLEAKARAETDAQLLRLYASVADVERAKARRLSELDSIIGITRGNLQSLRTQQANLQSQAANHERAGRKVPEQLLVQIDNLAKEQASLRRDVERYKQTRKQAEVSYGLERERVAELLGQSE